MNSLKTNLARVFSAPALAVILLLVSISGAASSAMAQDATTLRIEHADQEPQNWLTFYGNYRGWSYSPLNQITR
jgi:alcohol dehydrogenase (cytochrome c)